jgi:HEAT repeat protein
MEEAIQRIASSHNAVFAYNNLDNQIKTVRVFPRTAAIQQPSLVYLGTGTITKTNDDVNTQEQAIRALAENARLEMKEKAISILVSNKGEEATKALMSSLVDPAPEIREAAIAGLASFGNHDALPEIIKCLKDKDPKVRLSAATAVAYLGNYKNIPDLQPLSADKDANVAAEADKALIKWSAGVRK